jgi:hypothetical protein
MLNMGLVQSDINSFQTSHDPGETVMTKKINGFVFYRGPSMIDGKPIVAIATKINAKSANDKTGHMVQTFILRDDIAPLEALKTGQDESVCGNCRHRPLNAKARKLATGDAGSMCYVNVGHAPRSVWHCLHHGKGYPTLTPEAGRVVLAGKLVRCGSYGDPAAVPFEVWAELLGEAAGHTGYTHQWLTCDQRFRAICMASADTPEEMAMARVSGWRTFRVRSEHEALGDHEVICPASKEAGVKTNCASCKACGGTTAKARASIAIIDHGPTNRKRAA